MGCGGDDSCDSGPLNIIDMESLGCTNSVNLMKVRTGAEFELIRDQTNYDRLVSGPCAPPIDWEVYDLIILWFPYSKAK